METRGTWATPALPIYVAKGARVYVSGLMSVMLPAYLAAAGYSPFFVGTALAFILAGGAASNILLTYLERAVGRKKLLILFSSLIALSGAIFAVSDSSLAILVACLIGNVSTTGTEAGPFQSVEAGILPEVTPKERVSRAFGLYNSVGYLASALGAFTLYVPGSQGDSLVVFRALFLVFGAVGVLLAILYWRLPMETFGEGGPTRLSRLGAEAKQEITRLSVLFGMDAFGGSFTSQYLLSYWFALTFGVPATFLAFVFLATNVISAFSVYAAAYVGEKIGNLRTMVYTHVVSNVFLLMVALAGSLAGAVGFLFLRQAFSQMDVPTRQALMAQMFGPEDRVAAYALTNTVRSGSSFVGGPVSALVLGAGFASGVIYMGGVTKLLYDGLIFARYRRRFR